MTGITMEKKGSQAEQEADSQSVNHGAVEGLQAFQFSPEAERQLVRKIDFMSVALKVFRQRGLNMIYTDNSKFALGSSQSWFSHI